MDLVDHPAHGTTLIERLTRTLGGEAQLDYRFEGRVCRIALPLRERKRAALNAHWKLASVRADLPGCEHRPHQQKRLRMALCQLETDPEPNPSA
jgi:hypothetical protein